VEKKPTFLKKGERYVNHEGDIHNVGIVMYGRFRVCKDYLSKTAIQVCSHVSGLFARHLDRWP